MMNAMDYVEQSSKRKQPVIFGSKVILVPFLDVFDLSSFVRVHREDKKGFLCRFSLKNLNEQESEEYVKKMIDENQIYIWSVVLKGGEQKHLGFIYLSDVGNRMANINGVLDKQAVRRLTKEERRENKDMVDDSILALMRTCFENDFVRIAGDAIEDNKEAIKLHARLGFVREGILRKAVEINGQFRNVIIGSVLRDEWAARKF
jgi:RimJ/RimL family protein N-acetyltransferase